MQLLELLRCIEKKVCSPQNQSLKELWDTWLWRAKPSEEILHELGGFNYSNVLAMIIAKSTFCDFDFKEKIINTVDDKITSYWDSDLLTIYDVPIHQYTVRQFRDTLDNAQIQWKNFVNDGSISNKEYYSGLRRLLDRLMIHFGFLLSYALSADIMDDISSVTSIPRTKSKVCKMDLFVLTCKCMRSFCNTFLVLYRTCKIREDITVVETLPQKVLDEKRRNGWVSKGKERYFVAQEDLLFVKDLIKPFHIESSLDDFGVIQQTMFLSPGQKLVYMHNFSGMFNDISQVVYFHYPDYMRAPQLEQSELVMSSMHSLPAIR